MYAMLALFAAALAVRMLVAHLLILRGLRDQIYDVAGVAKLSRLIGSGCAALFFAAGILAAVVTDTVPRSAIPAATIVIYLTLFVGSASLKRWTYLPLIALVLVVPNVRA